MSHTSAERLERLREPTSTTGRIGDGAPMVLVGCSWCCSSFSSLVVCDGEAAGVHEVCVHQPPNRLSPGAIGVFVWLAHAGAFKASLTCGSVAGDTSQMTISFWRPGIKVSIAVVPSL
jgi:hypothetical protein